MSGASKATAAVRLFDAHCHLQDRRISAVAPQLIHTALDSGVLRFAVNGVSEKDWHLVKQMSDQYPCVIPCFGLHPWFITERSPNWLRSMRELFAETPAAAVGENLKPCLKAVAYVLAWTASNCQRRFRSPPGRWSHALE